MIVVMSKDSTEENLEEVRRRIEANPGLKPQVFHGVERIVVGVLGTVPPDLKEQMELLQGVSEVVPISKPYKLASREFHPDDSKVVVGSAVIGGSEPVIMAGPCSVEDEEQMILQTFLLLKMTINSFFLLRDTFTKRIDLFSHVVAPLSS